MNRTLCFARAGAFFASLADAAPKPAATPPEINRSRPRLVMPSMRFVLSLIGPPGAGHDTRLANAARRRKSREACPSIRYDPPAGADRSVARAAPNAKEARIAETQTGRTGERWDVFDTWQMTVTPAEGLFAGNCRVDLPGRQHVALRIRKAH